MFDYERDYTGRRLKHRLHEIKATTSGFDTKIGRIHG